MKNIRCIRLIFNIAIVVSILFLNACGLIATRDGAPHRHNVDIAQIPNAVPKPEPHSRYGNPVSYKVLGKTYRTLQSSKGYKATGTASWYGTKFHGQRTSSGETYDMYGMTAAHKTLPLPTYATVKNLSNNREVIVKINDRGPFHDGRIIDLSYAAAVKLGVFGTGTAKVEVTAINLAPKEVPIAEGVLFVQVGAFSQRENAKKMRDRLKNSDLQRDIHVVKATTGRANIFRVRVGPFDLRSEADRMAHNLMGMGIEEAKVIVD